jgi:hypothetical protein
MMQTIPGPADWRGGLSPGAAYSPAETGSVWQKRFRRGLAWARLTLGKRHLLLRPLKWLYDRWHYVRPVLFPATVVAFVVFGFTMEQGRDVLVATAAGTPQHDAFFRPQPWALLTSLLIFSFTAWYFARLALDAAGHHCKRERTSRLVRALPGLLGIAPLLAAAFVFATNAEASGCLALAAACVALAAAELLLAPRIRKWRDPKREIGEIMPPLITWGIVLVGAAVLVLVSLPSEWSRVHVPEAMGTATIVMIAGAVWIAFGTHFLVRPTLRHKLVPPLLLLFLGSSLLWNALGRNDNHTLSRAPADGRAARIDDRPSPKEQLDRWLAKRLPADGASSAPYPVVVIAAEGGGIRAAYWTALALTALEDRHPGFFCHVFAISGVSGGSLGAAVFEALVAEQRARGPGATDCSRRAELARVAADRQQWNCDPGSGRLCSEAQQLLGRDFLAPTTAGMLFPDLIQRFLPVAFLPDRQAYLEQAWEAAWDSEVEGGGKGRMAADFLGLWERDANARLPALLLNTTEVARGGRAIVSNLRLDRVGDGFVDVRDALAAFRQPIRLSTAVGLSARFSYVSPAADIELEDGHILRLVDGGYFENSGALTAQELMQASGLLTDYSGKVRPIVLIITNSTVDGLDNGSWPEQLLSESLPPLDAVLHARVARGEHAVKSLAGKSGREVIAIDLPPLKPGGQDGDQDRARCRAQAKVVRAVPLSWMLADDVKRYVDCMAAPQIKEVERELQKLLVPSGA